MIDDLIGYFDYLDGLRDSGVTNMFGAGRYLSRDCNLDAKTADRVLGQWMKTFNPDKTSAERAVAALAQSTHPHGNET